jgi:hypothetical protein
VPLETRSRIFSQIDDLLFLYERYSSHIFLSSKIWAFSLKLLTPFKPSYLIFYVRDVIDVVADIGAIFTTLLHGKHLSGGNFQFTIPHFIISLKFVNK